ncbi:hypothetical protein C8039_07030 [Halogeometricum sp. wsp3]|nr:hypothetical protein C8039_07030 [Halogeometricum sp. wsp3]
MTEGDPGGRKHWVSRRSRVRSSRSPTRQCLRRRDSHARLPELNGHPAVLTRTRTDAGTDPAGRRCRASPQGRHHGAHDRRPSVGSVFAVV